LAPEPEGRVWPGNLQLRSNLSAEWPCRPSRYALPMHKSGKAVARLYAERGVSHTTQYPQYNVVSHDILN
jgi:hypothetical protein